MNSNLNKLPPYLFVEIDKMKQRLKAAGKEVINFGIGDPDLLPPPEANEWLAYYSNTEKTAHQYPNNEGDIRFREAISKFYQNRFRVSLSPETEITNLIGSKEGLAHTILAYVNPGDVVLVPDPAYPVYENMTILVGGQPYKMPLLAENDFFPDFSSIPESVLQKTKLMFLCYPNNPTSRMADREKLREAIKLASKYNFVICYDNAYSEIYYQEPPISIFNVEGAREVAIEFNSFSKMFNLTGWRVAFALGRKELLFPILRIKQNVDSGTYLPLQLAAARLLSEKLDFVAKMREIYCQRKALLLTGLEALGFKTDDIKATFYIWLKLPKGQKSLEWSKFLLEKAGIVSTPGIGFGKYGEGYVRFSLTLPDEHIKKAVKIMKELRL